MSLEKAERTLEFLQQGKVKQGPLMTNIGNDELAHLLKVFISVYRGNQNKVHK